jgi:hypothetical protein
MSRLGGAVLKSEFASIWRLLVNANIIISESGKVCLNPAFEAELLERILATCLDYRRADESASSIITSEIIESLHEKLPSINMRELELCAEVVFVLLPKNTSIGAKLD